MGCSSNNHLSVRSENLLFIQQTFISQIRKCAVIQQTFISQIRKCALHPTNIYQSDQKRCCSSNKHLSVRSENLLFIQQTFISQIRKCAVIQQTFISQIRKGALHPTNIYQSDQKMSCLSNNHLSVRSEKVLFIQQSFISLIRKCALHPTNIYQSDQKMCCNPTNIHQSDQKRCSSSNKHLSVRSENELFIQQSFISQIRKCAVHPTNIHLSVRSENVLFIQQTTAACS